MAVLRLPEAGRNDRDSKLPRIDRAAERQPDFLPRRQRHSILIARAVEGRHDAHDALLFLRLHIALGLLFPFLRVGFGLRCLGLGLALICIGLRRWSRGLLGLRRIRNLCCIRIPNYGRIRSGSCRRDRCRHG
jgi:hypothetical protein